MTKPATKASDVIDMTAIEARLKDKSPKELREHFRECWNEIAHSVAECAVCVKLLEAAGQSLIGIPWAGTFRRVAFGQLLPELVSEFIESPNRRIVERLPKGDQRKIIDEPEVVIAVRTQEGEWTKRKADLRICHPEIAKQVVSDDGIRSFEEQQAYLVTQKTRPAPPPAEDDDSPGESPRHMRTIRLTDSELEELKHIAARNRISEQEMARRIFCRGLKATKVKS
jgi:hypothetical protein